MPADGQTDNRADGRFARALRVWIGAVRRIAGMPDYRAYLEHLREHHPEVPAPSEREFIDQYLETRYHSGPTRCC